MGAIPSTAGIASVRVLIDLGDPDTLTNELLWDVGAWDTQTWGATSDYFLDVTEWVQGVDTGNGRQRFTSRFKSGRCKLVLDNNDGRWTPGAGEPEPGFLRLRPGRRVQVFTDLVVTVQAIRDIPDATTWNGDTGREWTSHGNLQLEGEFPDVSEAQIYDGYIDTIADKRSRDGSISTVITAYDYLARANVNNLPAVAIEGAGDLANVRMQETLDHFDATPPNLVLLEKQPDPEIELYPVMLGTTFAQSQLAEMQITADSSGGGVWIDALGQVLFAGFNFFQLNGEGDPVWTLGGASPIQIRSVGASDWSNSRIINEAHIANTGGTEQVVSDSDSITIYGRRTHTRLDLQASTDQNSLDIATKLVENLSLDRFQITSLTVQPSNLEEAEFGATVAIGDVLLVTQASMFGWSWTGKTQVFGISHSVTDSIWSVTVLLDDTEIEQRGGFSSGFSTGFDI